MLNSKSINFNTPKQSGKRSSSHPTELSKGIKGPVKPASPSQNPTTLIKGEESNEQLKNELDRSSEDSINQGQGVINPTEPGYLPNLVKVEREEEARETEKLDHLVDRASEVLYSVSALAPFDLFPDQLVVALPKITLIRRSFFGSESITSIATDELSDVSQETTPFFTTLRLKPTGKEPVLIKFLPPSKGKEAGKILHGIVECNKAKINLLKLDASSAKEKIRQLGEVHT